MPDNASVREVRIKFSAAMDEYNKAVQEFKTSTNDIRKEMEQLSSALNKAVDAPAQQMKQWQTQLKRTGSELDSIDKKAQSLIATQRQLERDIETQTLELSRLDDEYKRIQDELQSTTDMYERISSVTEGIDLGESIEVQLERANATINRTADQIEELQEKIREASQYGYSIQLDDASVVSIDEAKQKLQELIEESDQAGAEFERLSNAMMQLSEQDFDFASTEGLQQLQDRLASLRAELENVGMKATSAADKLVTSGEKYTTVSGEISGLRNRVSSLGNQMGVMSQEVLSATGRSQSGFSRLRSAISSTSTRSTSLWGSMRSGASRAASVIAGVGTRLLGLRPGHSILSRLTSHMHLFRRSSDSTNLSLTRVARSIRNIGIVSLSLRFARSIFGTLRSVVNEYLAENEAAKQSVDNLKSAMANALAPAINVVINMLNKLMPVIEKVSNAFGALITKIFGVEWTTLSGSSSSSDTEEAADGLEDVANATYDLAKAEDALDLEGFDEINKLSDNTDYSSWADDVADATESVAEAATANPSYLMETPAWIDNLMDKLEGIWKVFKDAWDINGEAVINSATGAFESIKKLASDVGNTFYDVFTSPIGVTWASSLLGMFRSLFDAVKAIADTLDEAWTSGRGEKFVESLFERWTAFYQLITTIADSFTRVWSNGIGLEICERLLDIWTNINNTAKNFYDKLREAWEVVGDSVWQGILDIFDSILGLIEHITGATADWAGNLDFTNLLESIGGFLESIAGIIDKMSPTIEWLWEDILLPLADWTINELIPVILDAIGAALDVIGSVGAAAGKILKEIWDSFLGKCVGWVGDAVIWFFEALTNVLEWIANNETVCDILASLAIAVGMVALAFELFKIVVSDWKQIVIVAIIAAIIALADLIIENWDAICGWVEQAWQDVCDFFVGIWEYITERADALGDGCVQMAQDTADAAVKIANWAAGIFNDVIGFFVDLWNSFIDNIVASWDDVCNAFSDVINWIVQAFNDAIDWITGAFEDAIEWIETAWDNVVAFFSGIWDSICDVFAPVIDFFSGIFSDAWGAIKTAWDAVVDFFSGIWDGISGVFDSVGDWFGDTFGGAFDAIGDAFSSVGDFFGGVWNNIKSAFSTVTDWFSTTFKSAWEGVKNVFSKGGQIFNDIKQGILNGLGSAINWLIRGINNVIAVPFNAINSALRTISNVSIFGWKPFSFLGEINVPQIPEIALAEGAVIPPNAPFYAMMGDQTNGNNLEAPESLLRQIVREESGNGQGTQNIVVKLILDGKEVGQTVIDFINGQYSAGLNPLNL